MSDILNGEQWKLTHADCIDHMAEMPPASVDMSVFSPPFPSVFAYGDEPGDIGNSEGLETEAKLHISFFFRQLIRVLKPGRVAVVHCAQIARLKRSGELGLFDFRGMLIRLALRAGFTYEYDWMVRKNPQAQAIRTKKWELKFQGIETDRAMSRGTICDYLLKFRAPGENKVRINTDGEVSRNDWIKWAEGFWDDIIESDTLNVAEGRGEDDTKHICPLQLEVIRRIVLLYSDPGEIVFSPFAGIGSEGFMALGGKSPKTGRRIVNKRRFYGCELKPEYIAAAKVNMKRATKQHDLESRTLFDDIDDDDIETHDIAKAAEFGALVGPVSKVIK